MNSNDHFSLIVSVEVLIVSLQYAGIKPDQ